MHYSPSHDAFYADNLRHDYERAGSWPGDAVEVTDEEWQTFGLGAPPNGHRRGADEYGHPTWVPIPPPGLETLAARKRREIDTARDQAFAAGLPYDIAGEPDVVQTRPQDQINLLGLSAKAQRLVAEGVTDPVMPFRGLSNVTQMLTPEQMDALTLAALAHIEGIYQRSWDRKDAIDAAEETGDHEAIEAVEW